MLKWLKVVNHATGSAPAQCNLPLEPVLSPPSHPLLEARLNPHEPGHEAVVGTLVVTSVLGESAGGAMPLVEERQLAAQHASSIGRRGNGARRLL